MSVMASYSKTYPQTKNSVGEARRTIVAFARTCGFAGQALGDIEIAAGEALANAVEHGSPDCGQLEVSVWRDAAVLTIEIKDSGRGFDHSVAHLRARPPSEALRGFGTFIMRELMDMLEYSDRGTRLRLTKHLPARLDQRAGLEA